MAIINTKLVFTSKFSVTEKDKTKQEVLAKYKLESYPSPTLALILVDPLDTIIKISMSPFIDYIKKSIVLSEQEELSLLSKISTRKYLKGQYILQQGDRCKFLNFIISGTTKTFHIDSDGKEHIFRFAIENWWASDLPSFIDKVESNTNIQCLEDTEVIQISSHNLEHLYVEIPRLEHFFRVLFQRVSITLEKRIINTLSMSAKKKYLLFKEEYEQFEQRIPQYMIASYLGISKQYLSEIRNELISK